MAGIREAFKQTARVARDWFDFAAVEHYTLEGLPKWLGTKERYLRDGEASLTQRFIKGDVVKDEGFFDFWKNAQIGKNHSGNSYLQSGRLTIKNEDGNLENYFIFHNDTRNTGWRRHSRYTRSNETLISCYPDALPAEARARHIFPEGRGETIFHVQGEALRFLNLPKPVGSLKAAWQYKRFKMNAVYAMHDIHSSPVGRVVRRNPAKTGIAAGLAVGGLGTAGYWASHRGKTS